MQPTSELKIDGSLFTCESSDVLFSGRRVDCTGYVRPPWSATWPPSALLHSDLTHALSRVWNPFSFPTRVPEMVSYKSGFPPCITLLALRKNPFSGNIWFSIGRRTKTPFPRTNFLNILSPILSIIGNARIFFWEEEHRVFGHQEPGE